jgi:LTXXQ motif family protein
MAGLRKEDVRPMLAAKLAEMKTALNLSPAQQKHWAPLKTALVNSAKARLQRRDAVRKMRAAQKTKGLDLDARMRSRIAGLRSCADHVENVANAAKPLLASLDAGQKRRFGVVLRRNAVRRKLRRRWAS